MAGYGGAVVTQPPAPRMWLRVPGSYGIAMSREKTVLHCHTRSLSYLNGFDQSEADARHSSIPFDKKLQVNRIGEQNLGSTKT